MKQFFKWFVIFYVVLAILDFCLFWFVPDQFPGEPAPKGLEAFFAFIGPGLALVVICTAFPSMFLADAIASGLALPLAYGLLISLLVPAALWACLFVWLAPMLKRRAQRST